MTTHVTMQVSFDLYHEGTDIEEITSKVAGGDFHINIEGGYAVSTQVSNIQVS